jgi:hypothetical protein
MVQSGMDDGLIVCLLPLTRLPQPSELARSVTVRLFVGCHGQSSLSRVSRYGSEGDGRPELREGERS